MITLNQVYLGVLVTRIAKEQAWVPARLAQSDENKNFLKTQKLKARVQLVTIDLESWRAGTFHP